MVVRRVSGSDVSKTNRAPARTPDDRENELIEAATDLAEKQLRDGTASAQVTTHFLKLGSSRERLEQQRLKNEVLLMDMKREQMASEMRTEELIQKAFAALRGYSGIDDAEDSSEFDEYPD